MFRPFSVPTPAALRAPRRPRARASTPRGFALIITIVLVAFLVLILVGLATFTRVETQVADNSQQLAKARQNALMALNLALGQLQKHTGPDQRVTATADIGTGAVANRHWTGAWKNGNTRDYDPTASGSTAVRDNPALFNPTPALQSWLVSGNESSATGDTFKPTDAIPGLSLASTALDSIMDANGKPHRLLVKASAGIVSPADPTDPAALARAVTAPEVPITATNVPGFTGAQTIGHYAWWVGDEGVKARANLEDPYFSDGTGEANLTRLQSAQRPAIEAMHADFSPLDPLENDDSDDDYKQFTDNLAKVISPAQLAYLDSTPAFATRLKKSYHDLSLTSRGVLSDTKHGGLKADLTYLFGQPDLPDFRTALGKVYAINLGGTSHSVFDPAFTPYATRPSDAAFNTSPGIFSAAPTWEQLWSFANMNASGGDGVFGTNGSGALQARPRLQTNRQQGLYPLIMQCKMFYALRIDPATQRVWVDASVAVVLANPYNIKLAPENYTLRITAGSPRVRFGTTTALSDYSATTGQIDISSRVPGKTEFIVRDTEGIAAGQAWLFTIDPGNSGMTDNRVTIPGATAKQINLVRGFDPLTAITYDTGATLPVKIDDADKTHVALVAGPTPMTTGLYLNYPGTDDPANVVHYSIGQYTSTAAGLFFLVNPISTGTRVGGGYIHTFVQPPTTPGNNTTTNRVQQAVFYQMNYRAPFVNYSSSSPADSHPVEWFRTFAKNGDSVLPGSLFNPWLDADHLRSDDDPAANVRWGIVNRGEGPDTAPTTPTTLPPASIGGPTNASDVGFENFLYDLPRPGRSLSSLGQLQHFNPSGFLIISSYGSPATATYKASNVHTWQVNYPISNSYPHPRVERDNVYFHSSGFGYHFDGSYLWNDILWDRFHFSTFPQTGAFDFDPNPTPANTPHRLVNSRLRPFRDRTTTAWNEPENFRGDGDETNAANSRKAAQNLLVEGAFNINSTSEEAWVALLSSLRNVPLNGETPSAPVTRTLYPKGGSDQTETGIVANSFKGFRDLKPAQIEAIAQEMVAQVRQRGPFLSLSQFVNRKLVAKSGDSQRLGLGGALQSAIDRVVNQRSEVTGTLNNTTTTDLGVGALQDADYVMPTGISGFPGYVLQADVLSALGPTLSARSDTFTIRTYGDSVNPATGDVAGRAWCEAVVQRLPDYVNPATPATDLPAAGSDNEKFGRRYHIIGFRWLGPEDI